MPSIGLACNVYNERNAIFGLLENAAQFFDDIVFYHTGPNGAYSTDGTIEIIQRWGARLEFGSINEGFGVVRSKLLRMTNTEFTMILDADERFYPFAPTLECDDDLTVTIVGDAYNQGLLLRSLIEDPSIDAVCTVRRHWNNLHWNKPCQNWYKILDYQLRIARNCEHIYYKSEVKMHEQIWDDRTGQEPRFVRGNVLRGPFHDHYHCWYKPMELEQRQEDIAIYDALAEGRPLPPTAIGAE